MKVFSVKLRKIGQSQGFFIPIGLLADRIAGGLEIGKEYDLEITESPQEPPAMTEGVSP